MLAPRKTGRGLFAARRLSTMKEDLGNLIKTRPGQLRLLRIAQVHNEGFMRLRLAVVIVADRGINPPEVKFCEIVCSNAVDYSIRPKNPAIIEGGPLVEFYEKHHLLENGKLEMVPGGDGEVFDPPLKLRLLILDQSHVIAEKFEIEKCVATGALKNN